MDEGRIDQRCSATCGTHRTAGGAFLLTPDAEPLAWSDPHGAWLEWLG